MTYDRTPSELSAALRALREASTPAGASEAVERSLMASFRKKQQRSWVRWLWPGAAVAASLCVAALVTIPREPLPLLPSPKTSIATVASVAKPAPAESQGLRKRPKLRLSKAVRKPAVTVPRKEREFISVPYSPELLQGDAAQVVRVRLPRSSLQPFGLPLNVDRMFERVEADVLMGQDGIVRAVRLVR